MTKPIGISLRPISILLVTLALVQVANAQTLATEEEAAVRAAVANVADSVVQIRTIGGLDEVEQTLLPDGPTTGLVISPDGWIVSSSFNFVQQPSSILVTFASGETAPATLVAKDHSRMLVLLKAQGVSNLTVPQMVPADEIRVGQWAVAVGRTFRADRTNMSVGIVSALDRMYGKVIQTDADVSTATYGGPLVDIRGRVLGVVVPIAPQTTSEVAGAEWYDSGIGFAVPLTSIADALERMKRGENQFAGILGISMGADNPHGSPAILAAVPPSTPAGKAGLRKGDRIVEINGHPIARQTDLRFTLGPLYAGDDINVKGVRGDDTFERTIKLAGELEPFRHAFLGILPMRDVAMQVEAKPHENADAGSLAKDKELPSVEQTTGVAVRQVYDGSPAAVAGIRIGDRIVQIDDAKIVKIDDAIAAMNAAAPDSTVSIRVLRNGHETEMKPTASRLPANVPNDLPPAFAPATPAADKETPPDDAKPIELKLAEFSETCRLYVPPSIAADHPAGVVLWIHAPGEPPNDDFFRQWKSICDRDGLILVAPTAADPNLWEKTELEYLARLTERVLNEQQVDPRRVVVVGQGGGGAMAYLLGLGSRGILKGVVTTGAALPRTIQVPPNDPSARLAIYAGLPTESAKVAQVRQGLKKLADAGYPVTAITLRDNAGHLSEEERSELASWIDSLDRF